MNGAAEALLAELVDLQKGQADSLKTMASKMGGGDAGGGAAAGGGMMNTLIGGPFKIAGAAVGVFGKAVGAAADIVGGAFSSAMNLAGLGLGDLKRSGQALYQGQMQLAQGAIEGANTIASVTRAYEGLPGILGMTAKAMSYLNEKTMANVRTYQEMAQTGATLGGNLNEVRQGAAGMGLSMTEFGTLMKNSASQLRFMGNTADDGARFMIGFNKQFVMAQNGAGKGLLGMGFSLEEANGMLATYSAAIGGLSQDQLRDQKGLEQSVKAFAEELDLSAQLEGKTRKQKEDEMKAAGQQAAIQARLTQLGIDQNDYLAAYNSAMRSGGKGAVDTLNAKLLGLAGPVTEAGRLQASLNAQSNQYVLQQGDALLSGKKGAEFKKINDEKDAQARAASAKTFKENSQVMSVLSITNGKMAEQSNVMANNYTDQTKKGQKNAADVLDTTNKTRAAQKVAQESAVGAQVQAMGAAKHAGSLMDLLAEALKPLFPVVEWIIKQLPIAINAIMKFGTKIINEVIVPAFKELFGGISMDDFLKPFKDFWSGLFGDGKGLDLKSVKDGIVSFMKPIVDFFKSFYGMIDFKAVGASVRKVFGDIKDFFGAIFGAFSTTDPSGTSDLAKDVFAGYKWFFGLLSDIWNSVDWKAVGTQLGQALKKAWDITKEILTPIFEKIGVIFRSIAGDLGPVLGDLFDIVNSLLDIIQKYIWPIVKPVVAGFLDAMLPLWNAFKNIIKFIKDILAGNFKDAGKHLWEAITSLTDAMMAWISGIFDGIKNLASMGWSALKSMLGFGDKKEEAPKPAEVSKPGEKTENTPGAKPEDKKAETAPAGPGKTPEEKRAPSGAEVKPTPKKEEPKEETPTLDPAAMKSKDPTEILRAEIQLLNKQTALMLSALRENRDWSRTTAEKINAFGNKFKG